MLEGVRKQTHQAERCSLPVVVGNGRQPRPVEGGRGGFESGEGVSSPLALGALLQRLGFCRVVASAEGGRL
jgi:hypothetical protein